MFSSPELVRRFRLRMAYALIANGVLFVGVSAAFLIGFWNWVPVGILVAGVLLIVWGVRRIWTIRHEPNPKPLGHLDTRPARRERI